jgi:hypothetical protein
VLGVLEPFLLSILPVTAGQLYAFRYDSTARRDAFLDEVVRERVAVAEMLTRCATHD